MSQSIGIGIKGQVKSKIFTYKGLPSVILDGEILSLYNYNLEASTFKVVKLGEDYYTVSNKEAEKEYHGSTIKERATYEMEQVAARSEEALESLRALSAKYNVSEADLGAQCAQIQGTLEASLSSIQRLMQANLEAIRPLETDLVKAESSLKGSEVIEKWTNYKYEKLVEQHDGMASTIRSWFEQGFCQDLAHDIPMLHVACQIGSLEIVKQIVKCKLYDLESGALLGFTLNPFVNENTFSPMHVALVCGHIPIVNYLFGEKPSLVNIPTPTRGIPPLLCAAAGGTETLSWILSKGVDIRHVASNGLTAAHTAAMMGHISVLRMLELLAPKLLNQATDAEVLPIHCAALKGGLEVLKYFIGPNPSSFVPPISKRNGWTIEHYAASANQVQVLDWMFNSGFDMSVCDLKGLRIAHHAAVKGSVDALQWIVDHKFNPLPIDNSGKSPLDHAKQNNVTATISFYQKLAQTDPSLSALINGQSQFSTLTPAEMAQFESGAMRHPGQAKKKK